MDTSVIIEYIDEIGSLHSQAKAIFSAIISGKLEAIIPSSILAETYYVSARIYDKLGFRDFENRAIRLVEWLYRLPLIKVVAEDLRLILEAGRIKFNYGLALTDCFVIAASKVYNCKAVFKKLEREMLNKFNELQKEYNIIFLEYYK